MSEVVRCRNCGVVINTNVVKEWTCSKCVFLKPESDLINKDLLL